MAKTKPPFHPLHPGDLNLTQQSINNDLRYRKLIENSYEGIILLDKEFNISFRSRSAEHITGWTKEKRGKQNITEIMHPDDREAVRQMFVELAKDPYHSRSCIFRFVHFEGHYIWLECVFTNFFNDPDIGAMVCNFQDITDKKDADELLQKSINELSAYKYALDESAIVAVTDQKGIITYVNDTFCRIAKYNKEELIGQDHRIINSSYHKKASIRNLWMTIARGNIWKGEFKNKAKDGSFYWVDTTIVPFLNEKGKPYKYVSIRFDITEHKRIISALEESEKNYSELFNLSPLPKMVIDLDNLQFLDVNEAAIKHYGFGRQEFLSMTLRDIKPIEDIAELEVNFKNDQLKEKKNSLGIFRQKKKNGEVINVDIQANFIEYKGKNAKVIIATDITDRLKYIKEIESQNEKLREISWIQSHVVRAPVARIIGLIALINDPGYSDEERAKMLEFLMVSSKELDGIITQISEKAID